MTVLSAAGSVCFRIYTKKLVGAIPSPLPHTAYPQLASLRMLYGHDLSVVPVKYSVYSVNHIKQSSLALPLVFDPIS